MSRLERPRDVLLCAASRIPSSALRVDVGTPHARTRSSIDAGGWWLFGPLVGPWAALESLGTPFRKYLKLNLPASGRHLEATEGHLGGWRQLRDTVEASWRHLQEPPVKKQRVNMFLLDLGTTDCGAADRAM